MIKFLEYKTIADIPEQEMARVFRNFVHVESGRGNRLDVVQYRRGPREKMLGRRYLPSKALEVRRSVFTLPEDYRKSVDELLAFAPHIVPGGTSLMKKLAALAEGGLVMIHKKLLETGTEKKK